MYPLAGDFQLLGDLVQGPPHCPQVLNVLTAALGLG
jgi:hypothetical protein